MRGWKPWTAGILVCLACLFAGVGISFSALTAGYAEVIKIAYMNGFIEAVNQDMAQIQRLKDAPDLLRTSVTASAEQYVERVSRLNQEN